MAFARPTLSALIARVKGDLRSRLSIAGPLVRRAMADVLGTVWGGAVHMLHGHLEWLGKQLFADVSEREYLLRQAAMYGITPTPASFASGTTLATGTNGSVIPIDAVLLLDGVSWRVTAEATIAAGVASVAVEAVEAGAAGNVEAGETITFESPVAGVDAETTVEAPGIDGGSDEESTEETRARLILRLREPPAGGRDPDYVGWALAVAGVTRVWVFPHENGLGTVVVRFVRDEDTPSIFPSAGEVADVQAALDEQRPITAEVTAVAPTSLAVDFDIALDPDSSDLRTAVEAELTDLLYREAAPGDGAGQGTILLSHILTAIGVAVGDGDFVLSDPVADVVPTLGQLAVKGTVTWL